MTEQNAQKRETRHTTFVARRLSTSDLDWWSHLSSDEQPAAA